MALRNRLTFASMRDLAGLRPYNGALVETQPRRRSALRCGLFCWLALSLSWSFPAGVRAVVISEIHYNPAFGEDALEFVELSNDSSTPEDLSGYSFIEGIRFTFPAGTILAKNGIIVVCADVDAVKARYGITNTIGNFIGRLDSSGERLTLANHSGIVVQSVRYRDRGKWPVAPDGTGHSLVLRHLHLDPTEPESWAQSPELGGSPGRPNFAASREPSFETVVLIERGAIWRYAKGTQPFSTPATAWRQPGFDDSSWLSGPSGFGYGDDDDATILTDMLNNYTSVACRRKFQLTAGDLAAEGELTLGMDFDDGFCAFLNGVEIARVNCDASFGHTSTASGSREAGVEDLFVIPRNLLVEGENVLAVVGYNFSIGSSDFSLIPRLLLRRRLPGPEEVPELVFNELFRSSPPGSGWVEVYNPGAAAVNLSGVAAVNDPGRAERYRFPAGSTVPGRGFLAINEVPGLLDLSTPEVRIFLLTPSGLALAASRFERPPPPGRAVGQYSEARFPDGGPLEWVTATPTKGAANQVQAVTDLVINEIFYHPPEDRAGEFIELYNRGSSPIDLSGFSFDKGISYTFEAGTTIPARGYVVVAEDPAILLQNYGYGAAFGPYTGKLANDGENVRLVDAWGNPVNSVRYHDGGTWSRWADGRGSSLELIDPTQDNSFASAWEASDESGKSEWEELKFTAPDYIPSAESELHLFLVARGACLIDDVSIRRGGGNNQIPNPGFETSTSGWLIQGTHVRSRRVTYDAHSGNACLELNASGKGDTIVNRVEIECSPPLTRGPYDVSLWARWLRGASLLVAHGQFTPGPDGGRPGPATNLSGNTLAARFRLTVPRNLGTPGAENSATRRLRELTGSVNLGPVIDQVTHSPPLPSAGEQVHVRARISDSTGVQSVRVLYRQGSAAGTFSSATLADDGLNQDGAAGDGVYGGFFGGFANGARIVFYIEASDTAGAVRRFPVDAPQTTCLFQVQAFARQTIESVRVILDDARTQELSSRPLHSNDLLDGAFVYENDEVFYNVGLRYRGSPWGRPGRNGYRVRFEKDQPYHRGFTAINLSSRGASATEGSCYFLVGRNGTHASPAPTADHLWVRSFLNGNSLGTQSLIQTVDRQYIEKWYSAGAQGPVLKANGRLQFNDGGDAWLWDGASFVHMGPSSEAYRSYFYHSIEQNRDDWEPFIALTRIMDRRLTNAAAFDAQIDSILDVEAFLRVLSARVLQADWDAFTIGNGHNGYLAYDGRVGRWGLLPFDMDNALGDANFPLYPSHDGDVARLMSRPLPRRIYIRILSEFLDGYWSAARAGPFLDALQRDVGVGTGGVKGFLTTRGNNVLAQIRTSIDLPFRIVTGGGLEIITEATQIELQGDASVKVATILYQHNGGELIPLQPAWTTATRWRAQLELPEADNRFQFLGFSGEGELLATTAIRVESTSQSSEPRVTAWFPSSGPASGGFEVVFRGRNFVSGMRIFFGSAESLQVTVDSPESVRALAPPASLPLPSSRTVDVELVMPDGKRVVVERAILYELLGGFIRGDANYDLTVDISDALATLLFLFAGRPIACASAADFDDNGVLQLTDSIATLDYLFRGGPRPPPPFPQAGEDPTPDALTCAAASS
jgi:hypothetical protein